MTWQGEEAAQRRAAASPEQAHDVSTRVEADGAAELIRSVLAWVPGTQNDKREHTRSARLFGRDVLSDALDANHEPPHIISGLMAAPALPLLCATNHEQSWLRLRVHIADYAPHCHRLVRVLATSFTLLWAVRRSIA